MKCTPAYGICQHCRVFLSQVSFVLLHHSDSVVAGPVLEELPKWSSLRDILEEAQRDRRKVQEGRSRQAGGSSGGGCPVQGISPILVVCKELYMCQQLPQAVAGGAVHFVVRPKCIRNIHLKHDVRIEVDVIVNSSIPLALWCFIECIDLIVLGISLWKTCSLHNL